MRRWIVIFTVIIVLALLAAAGYFAIGPRQSSRLVSDETPGGFEAKGKSATLSDVLGVAGRALGELENQVHDYSAVIITEQRIGNELFRSVMFAKIREKPFSVYLRFLERRAGAVEDSIAKGREVIYVQNQNSGNLLVHTPGLLDNLWGTMKLDPNGLIAMRNERYPVTEIGLANLCRQLIKRGESIPNPGRVLVRECPHTRINTSPCTLWEVLYPVHEPNRWGYLTRVFVDDALHVPIRVEVYELPQADSKEPRLVEAYTYLDLKLNRGYTDADFNPKDPQYKFP